MAEQKRIIQNSFQYGQVGERLIANRTNEIYNNSAKEIRNMLITDLGTLRVAKQFKSKKLSIRGKVIRVLDIKDDRYIILTSEKIYQLDKSNDGVIHTIPHSMGENVDCSLISRDYVAIFSKLGTQKFRVYNLKDMSEKTNYKFRNPIRNREVLEMDLWRVSKNPTEPSKFRVVKMASFKNPKIKVSGNVVYLNNSNIRVQRIYVDYSGTVDENSFSDIKDGDIYGIMRVFYKADNVNGYVLDNSKVTIGALTEDKKYGGRYFSQINSGIELDGELTFGEFVSISNPSYISFYQNRTIFYVDNYMYFSKIRDFFNFRNGIESDAPFYIQLNPINNSIGSLLGMIGSNGLYVLTTAGIYVLGYNNYLLTPSSISSGVIVVSDMGVSNVYDTLDNVVYFMNNHNILKSTMLDSGALQLNFLEHTVDKYSINNKFKDITRVSIEDKDYIMARSIDNHTMYLIENLDNGLFRTVSLDFQFEGRPFGLSDRFIINDKVYSLTNKNYPMATIIFNPPQLNGNNILMDNASSIVSVAIKLINEDREAVKGVEISNTNIRNLSKTVPDKFNIYKLKSKLSVDDGLYIKILTNENEKVCEFQSIQLMTIPVEDR